MIFSFILIGILAALTSVIARTGIRGRQTDLTSVTVNVYFHVILDNDGKGSVSDEQLNKQINVLNTGFTNAFITFNLANTSHNINSDWFRITESTGGNEQQMKQTLRKADASASDLNVYLVGKIDIEGDIDGFATFPDAYSNNPVGDGVVMLSSVLPDGSAKNHNSGTTLTYLVGTWTGLQEIVGGCQGDDNVLDTPQVEKTVDGCPKTVKLCDGSKDEKIMHNFMNGLSTCKSEFTDGQVSFLRDNINKYRNITK